MTVREELRRIFDRVPHLERVEVWSADTSHDNVTRFDVVIFVAPHRMSYVVNENYLEQDIERICADVSLMGVLV